MGLEEPAGEHGEATDMLLRGPTELVVIEIERFLIDWQAQLRRWTVKRDWLTARDSRPVRLVVAVADTRRNRAAVAPYARTIQHLLPASTRAVMTALRTRDPLGSDGLC